MVCNRYAFFKFVCSNKDQIISTINEGVLPEEYPGLTNDLRDELNRHLKPNPQRATQLRDIFADNYTKGLALKIWPNVTEITCARSGGMAHSAKLLEDTYTVGVNMFFMSHAATEGVIGLVYQDPPSEYIYTFVPTSVFFEFIPVENMVDENPRTLFLDQLEIDQSYEVVITNIFGLYRYRFGDVIRVCGFVGNTPKYEYMYRSGQILNIAFERTHETVFYNALHKTAKNWQDVELVDYTTTESTHLDSIAGSFDTPAHYVVFIELTGNGDSQTVNQKESKQLDEDLCSIHDAYKDFRNKQCVGQLNLIQVNRGTFRALADLLCDDMMHNAFKMPRVLRKKEALQLLWQRRVHSQKP